MNERHIDLARYRIDKAHKCVETAKKNVDANDYESAANRSYYAMFHAVRAILALEGVDFKSHMQVIGYSFTMSTTIKISTLDDISAGLATLPVQSIGVDNRDGITVCVRGDFICIPN